MTEQELEEITAYNLHDLAYYEQEAEMLRQAAEQGRHGGEGEEVDDG